MSTTQTTSIPGYVAGTWAIDPVHSEVGFTVRHMMVSKVRGKFARFDGQFVTGADPLDSSVTATIEPDPTNNPLDRLLVRIDPEQTHISAWDLADALARGAPPIIVRDHEIEHGYFFLDPCSLHPGEAAIVADRLAEELDRARRANEILRTPLEARRRRRLEGLMRWPD